MEPGKNVLVVEDDRLLAENIKQTLTKEGFSVSGVARNLKEAVDIMKRNVIDIALIDIQLDGPEDGVATATELLRIKWIPIIYITAHTPLEMDERMKKTLPAAFLEKPLRVRELAVQIELALHNFGVGNLPSAYQLPSEQLFLPADKGHIGVKIREILYLKADRVYSQLFLSEKEFSRIYPGRTYGHVLILSNMGSVFRRLPADFYLLSRSLVINLNHLARVDSNRLFMQQHEIPIPEGRRKDLIDRLAVVKSQ